MVRKLKIPWASMSIEDKRRTIARDALYQIERGTLKPTKGVYVHVIKGKDKLSIFKPSKDFWGTNYHSVQVNEVLCDIKCNVCAKGALFLGHVDRFNKLKSDLNNTFSPIPCDETKQINRRLKPIFGNLQMDMIECAFEKVVCTNRSRKLRTRDSKNTEIAETCIAYGRKYRKVSDRLVAILKNIIRNGEFKP